MTKPHIKIFFAIVFLFQYYIGNAQITWDTTRSLSRHEAGYGAFKPSVKAATYLSGNNFGVQVLRVKNNLSLVWLLSNTVSKSYGITWEQNRNYEQGLFGVIAGVDVDFPILHVGASVAIQTELTQLKYFLVPEIGFSYWGKITMFYGYSINLNQSRFVGTNANIIGLKYNFTKELAKEFKKAI
jgi:hypothetical protein